MDVCQHQKRCHLESSWIAENAKSRHKIQSIFAILNHGWLSRISIPWHTEPSYQNESSDSGSRKPLDQFKNAFDTKYIDLFHATFVTTISLNTTIHSINQIKLSSFMHNPSLFPFATKWELEQSCTVHGNAFCMHSDIWKQNGGAEKVLDPWIRGIKGI